jgi:uncharacterized protein (TIGR02145 family)
MKRKKIFEIILIVLFILVVISCSENKNLDQEGNVIKKTEIGEQVWSGENLNVTHFRNGDLIPEAKNADEYFKYYKEKSPCWCYYDFDIRNEIIYGKLYNWYAVNDTRNLAPEGWRVSSKQDWEELIDFLGGSSMAASKLKSTELNLWVGQSENIKDSYSFCAKPGGFYSILSEMGDNFHSLRLLGGWWCSNSIDDGLAHSIFMYSNNEYKTESEINIEETEKRFALAVRIICDTRVNDKSSNLEIKASGPETKILTYKWCECNDFCNSLFVDENDNEYYFGDLSDQNNINFQCYSNNSSGGIDDELKGQKFKVTYIKISNDDFELIKITSINGDLSTGEKMNGENAKSFSEIRSLIISGTKQNMIRQLGNPNEEYSADDFMEKYYNWKAFSVYSAQRLLYSQVLLYDNVDNTGKTILVVYSSHNGRVYEVMYKDDLKSYEDLSVNFGND